MKAITLQIWYMMSRTAYTARTGKGKMDQRVRGMKGSPRTVQWEGIAESEGERTAGSAEVRGVGD